MSPHDLFKSYRQTIPREALDIIRRVADHLDREPEIVTFPPGDIEDKWISFNVGDRGFGIWRHGFTLFAQEGDGSMGLDALNPDTLRPLG